jgi:hypothetical protein
MYPLCSLHEIQIFPKKPKIDKKKLTKNPKFDQKGKSFQKKQKKQNLPKKAKNIHTFQKKNQPFFKIFLIFLQT